MSQRVYTCLHPHTFMSLPSFRYCTWLTRIAHTMATTRGCLLPSSPRAILSGQLNHFRVASALLSLKRGKLCQFMVLQFLKSFPGLSRHVAALSPRYNCQLSNNVYGT